MHRKIHLIFILLFSPLLAAEQVHFILAGGPALRQWEDLRVESSRHDRWWANFIRASTLRMVELRKAHGKDCKIVWAVYKDGYARRGSEDGKPLTTWISDLAKKRNVKLIWYSKGSEVIKAFNTQPKNSIATFDYFGHSNRWCFMLDYSCKVSAASKCWLHEKDIYKIKKSVFKKHCISQSWGCYTGESMNEVWRRSLKHPIIAAKGKTDYKLVGQGKMPAINGSWVR